MIHLRSLTARQPYPNDAFPFNVPAVRALDTLTFESEVTFFVGENGSGKSTLLEAIASAVGSITVGATDAHGDPTLSSIRLLARELKLVWNKRTRRGFFMRSEDFFGFVKRIAQTRQELEQDLKQVDIDYADRPGMARDLARMPFMRELHGIQQSYGDDLDAHSHGESYFTLFKSRFVPGGLYLLDEPEAPLSPQRQLSFIAMLHAMLAQDAQFIIATHSPILLAYPGATILSFDDGQVQPVAYDDLEHVQITRSFLNNPDAYLRHLLDD
jgi:predicted ATPase